jgi:hypothetical protein
VLCNIICEEPDTRVLFSKVSMSVLFVLISAAKEALRLAVAATSSASVT